MFKYEKCIILLYLIVGSIIITTCWLTVAHCECGDKTLQNETKSLSQSETFEIEKDVKLIDKVLEEEFLLQMREGDDLETAGGPESQDCDKNLTVLALNRYMNEEGEVMIVLKILIKTQANVKLEVKETFKQDLENVIEDFWDIEVRVPIEVTVEKIEKNLDGFVELKLIVEYDERNVDILKDNFDDNEKLFQIIKQQFNQET